MNGVFSEPELSRGFVNLCLERVFECFRFRIRDVRKENA